MENKTPIIPPTLMVFLIFIALIVIVVSHGSKSTNAEAEASHTESYKLYVLDNFSDGESRLTLYNNYKVKLENIKSTDTITIYNTTDGTRIVFANNGVTIINPKGYKESFTQGYMKRKIGDNNGYKEKAQCK